MNAKRFFLLFFLCALVPFAAAKLSLSLGWFTAGATNKGVWLEQEVQLMPALNNGDLHWTVAYISGGGCDEHCTQALSLLQQLYLGLGRKQLGVQAMFMSANGTHMAAVEKKFPALKTLPVNLALSNAPALSSFENQFVILNQQGVALLRYPLSRAPAQQVAADVRSDLLRLFNYDRSRL